MEEKNTDLVCGMYLDDYPDLTYVIHKGKKHAFCGEGCATRFRHDPERFFGTPLIKLRDVKKVFKLGEMEETKVLRGVNLNVWKGDFLAIVGFGATFAGVNGLFSFAALDFPGLFAILMFTFVVGVISGILPARQAAKMDPATALRYE